MNNMKNILFFVFVSLFSIAFASDKQQPQKQQIIFGDDFSSEESGVFESGWQNHLNALSQDMYWNQNPVRLKDQWVNSAIKAAINENKSLEDFAAELNNKLNVVITDKFKDRLSAGQVNILVDRIVNESKVKFDEREKKRDHAKVEFLLSLQKVSSNWTGALNVEWKKNILIQIKNLIQLGVKGNDIAKPIEIAITTYNDGLSFYSASYAISDEEKEGILTYINDMEIIRDFQLQQLSTSGLQVLMQLDVPKEQQDANKKLQDNFRYWLKLVGEKNIDENWQKVVIDKAKDLIDVYQNPQIVIDKINSAFDQEQEILNKNKGLDIFGSTKATIETINQVKNKIINNIMKYLRDYANQSEARKAEKISQQPNKELQQIKQRLQQQEAQKREVQSQVPIQKEIQQRKDLYSVAKEMAQSTGKFIDWIKALSWLQKQREERVIQQNQPKEDEKIAKEQTWDEIVAERKKQRELRLNPPKEELDRIKKEREEWQELRKKWAIEEAERIKKIKESSEQRAILAK